MGQNPTESHGVPSRMNMFILSMGHRGIFGHMTCCAKPDIHQWGTVGFDGTPWGLMGLHGARWGKVIKVQWDFVGFDGANWDSMGQDETRWGKWDFAPLVYTGLKFDGEWGWWGTWGSCSASCLGGTQIRTRMCDSPATANGGIPCAGDSIEDQSCNDFPCPAIDGEWGPWAFISKCTKTCDSGFRKRERFCDNPPPQNHGLICPGGLEEDRTRAVEVVACNFRPCPVHGKWSSWTAFSECSLTCGMGLRTRTRVCDEIVPAHDGYDCFGSSIDTVPCELNKCAVVNGNWGPWQEWTKCSTTCGKGAQSRIRSCDNPSPANGGSFCPKLNTQSRPCTLEDCVVDEPDVDGGWTEWPKFTDCSQTCGPGQKIRVRMCSNPPTSGNGKPCDKFSNSQSQVMLCNEGGCPVDGQWSEWSTGECSVSCGLGEQSRVRRCDNPPPEFNGAKCLGASAISNIETEKIKCYKGTCPDGSGAIYVNDYPDLVDTSTELFTTTTDIIAIGSTLAMVNKTTTTGPIGGNMAINGSGEWDGGTMPNVIEKCPLFVTNRTIWLPTEIWEESEQNCLEGFIGTIKRRCLPGGVWGNLDISNCKSPQMVQLEAQIAFLGRDDQIRASVLDDFKTLCDTRNIFSIEEVLQCKIIFNMLVNLDFLGLEEVATPAKKEFVLDVLRGLNSMLDPDHKQLWIEIVKEEQYENSNSLADILETMERLGSQVVSLLKKDENELELCKGQRYINFCVQLTPRCPTTNVQYPKESQTAIVYNKHLRGDLAYQDPRISHGIIPKEILQHYRCPKSATDLYRDMRGLITISYTSLDEIMPNENKEAISDKPITNSDTGAAPRAVNSEVFTIKLDPPASVPLEKPVTIKLYQSKTSVDPKCVYIDTTSKSNLYQSDGCRIKVSTNDYIICECNHLTSFTVLMDTTREPSDRVPYHNPAAIIGGLIQLVSIIIAIVMYCILRMFWEDKYFALMNIYGAAFVATLTYMAGWTAVSDQIGCIFVAALMQYLFLVTIVWTLCLIVILYKQAFEECKPIGRRKRIVYAIFCWGIPLFVSAVSVGIGFEQYMDMQNLVCWLTHTEMVSLGWFIPLGVFTLVCVIVWAKGFSYMGTQMVDTNDADREMEFEAKRGYMKRVLALLIALCIAWNVDVYESAYVALGGNVLLSFIILFPLCFLDEDIIAERRRRKAEAEDEEKRRNTKNPDWTLQTLNIHDREFTPEPQETNETWMGSETKGKMPAYVPFDDAS
ncbi:unnamed protein product [Owenia fusiformis]|uniref:Uncharacterized protein n=1 Tax=Owenia fusiformis TaxID=6347 RepID=A0A8J1XTV5_OWEFU|nr:unnamed protein product [Owenia fusiformis]